MQIQRDEDEKNEAEANPKPGKSDSPAGALDTMDTVEMDAAFANSLRGWIAIGVQRMIRQDRVSPPDVTLAHVNLIKFIGLLKKEAMYLGHPLRLRSDTLIAAKKRLRLRASATAFELWPFWPHNFVVS
jgi:hypothetical protein